MKRKEEIEQQAKSYTLAVFDELEDFSDVTQAYIDGAEWMQEKMLDEACECIIKLHNWPVQYEEFAKFQEEFITAFRKAMEE